MSEPTGPRKFTLLDLMVLVAATAVGTALWRAYDPESLPLSTNVVVDLSVDLYYRVSRAALILEPWTVALLVLRLRRPRPRFHLIMGQAGTAASVAAILIPIVVNLPHLVSVALGPIGPMRAVPWRDVIYFLPRSCGSGVASAWLILALSGHWRTEPSWIDRLGRALGVGWIMVMVVTSFLHVLVF